jgi:hypothetical protein
MIIKNIKIYEIIEKLVVKKSQKALKLSPLHVQLTIIFQSKIIVKATGRLATGKQVIGSVRLPTILFYIERGPHSRMEIWERET